jgi:hypothetical protein
MVDRCRATATAFCVAEAPLPTGAHSPPHRSVFQAVRKITKIARTMVEVNSGDAAMRNLR